MFGRSSQVCGCRWKEEGIETVNKEKEGKKVKVRYGVGCTSCKLAASNGVERSEAGSQNLEGDPGLWVLFMGS